jgi:hypothetical protein
LLICIGFFENIQESTTQNTGTNEQLVIRKRDGGHLLIGRCPSDVDGQKWVEEMAQEACEMQQKERRKIRIADLGLFICASTIESNSKFSAHSREQNWKRRKNLKKMMLMSRDPASKSNKPKLI